MPRTNQTSTVVLSRARAIVTWADLQSNDHVEVFESPDESARDLGTFVSRHLKTGVGKKRSWVLLLESDLIWSASVLLNGRSAVAPETLAYAIEDQIPSSAENIAVASSPWSNDGLMLATDRSWLAVFLGAASETVGKPKWISPLVPSLLIAMLTRIGHTQKTAVELSVLGSTDSFLVSGGRIQKWEWNPQVSRESERGARALRSVSRNWRALRTKSFDTKELGISHIHGVLALGDSIAGWESIEENESSTLGDDCHPSTHLEDEAKQIHAIFNGLGSRARQPSIQFRNEQFFSGDKALDRWELMEQIGAGFLLTILVLALALWVRAQRIDKVLEQIGAERDAISAEVFPGRRTAYLKKELEQELQRSREIDEMMQMRRITSKVMITTLDFLRACPQPFDARITDILWLHDGFHLSGTNDDTGVIQRFIDGLKGLNYEVRQTGFGAEFEFSANRTK